MEREQLWVAVGGKEKHHVRTSTPVESDGLPVLEDLRGGRVDVLWKVVVGGSPVVPVSLWVGSQKEGRREGQTGLA